MKTNTSIGGVKIHVNFSTQVNADPISDHFASNEPVVNIVKGSSSDSYLVNIMAFVPKELDALQEDGLASGLFLNEEQSLFLSYNGARNYKTSIQEMDTLVRDFGLEYRNTQADPTEFNLIHVQFQYSFEFPNMESCSAALVRVVNEDPEGDRGTVTTINKGTKG
ncbi:MAG: hypothetical protein ACPGRE_08555 [Flavobacteriaceae bacterium]